MLVSEDGADGNLDAINGVVAKGCIRWQNCRERGGRNIENVAEHRVPGQSLNVEEECPAGITGVGDVACAICQAVDQPAVDGAKGEVIRSGGGGDIWDVCQHPGPLCSGEVWVYEETCPVSDFI